MRIGFNLEYQTIFGEELMLNILAEGKTEQHKMGTLDGLHWMCELNKTVKADKCIDYFYSVVGCLPVFFGFHRVRGSP